MSRNLQYILHANLHNTVNSFQARGLVGRCLVKLWRTQQQNVLETGNTSTSNRPQGCVRKHFLLLSCLSQQKITLAKGDMVIDVANNIYSLCDNCNNISM